MDHDVQGIPAEVRFDAASETIDAEVARVLVALAAANVLRRIGERVVRGIERIDLLELEKLSSR